MNARAQDEADLAALTAHVQGLPVPTGARRRLVQIRDADTLHDPSAARFWANHPFTESPDTCPPKPSR